MPPIAKPHYTTDWTSHHFADWQRWLGHLAGHPAVGLEIGTFEGRSARWFMEHILTSDASTLTCIDPYDYQAERDIVPGGGTHIAEQFDWQKILDTARENLSAWIRAGRLQLLTLPSRQALHDLPLTHRYDFAFVDGSHVAPAVLEDSVLIWPHIARGGIVIWDDYDWTRNKPGPWNDPEVMRPKLGIDNWLRVYSGQYNQLEHCNGQVKVCKCT